MNELQLFEKDMIEKMNKAANMLSKAGVIPHHLRGKVPDIFAILLMGSEVGLPPMQSLNQISVIKGKPTMDAQLLIALAKDRCDDFKVTKQKYLGYGPKEAAFEVHARRGEEVFETKWDMDRAHRMGLAAKDNYLKQPETMLKWRALSEAVRTLCPDAISGFAAKQDFQDLDGQNLYKDDSHEKRANALNEDLNKVLENESLPEPEESRNLTPNKDLRPEPEVVQETKKETVEVTDSDNAQQKEEPKEEFKPMYNPNPSDEKPPHKGIKINTGKNGQGLAPKESESPQNEAEKNHISDIRKQLEQERFQDAPNNAENETKEMKGTKPKFSL